MHDAGAEWIYRVAMFNPFTHAVEAMRHALYGDLAGLSLSVVIASTIVFYLIAAAGYDPQRGLVKSSRL
jgi:ABC-2 type transport system permease protein